MNNTTPHPSAHPESHPTIHPEIAKILALIPASSGQAVDHEAVRATTESQVQPLEERLPIRLVQDAMAATERGDVPVRVYADGADSASEDGRATSGVIVYFHGGAFFQGSLESHDHVCRLLAQATGWTVVSVGYRLAPEHAFPAGLEDCYAVVRWVAERGDDLGWDGQNLAVAGDSSGATFAAAIAAKAHDDGLGAISHQLLYYPSLDLDFDGSFAEGRYPSIEENAVGYGLEKAGLKPYNAFYLDSGADPQDPYVSPIKRADLAGLPRALVVTAQFDPLRDEGELYARRLEEAGVPVELIRFEDANHGFMQNFSWVPDMRRVYAQTAEFLRG